MPRVGEGRLVISAMQFSGGVPKSTAAPLADAIEAGHHAVELNRAFEVVRTIGRGVVNILASNIVLLGLGLVEDMPKLFFRTA